MTQLILASTSESRRKILTKLGVPFTAMAPDCDETPMKDESPQELVLRLSEAKALSIAKDHPDSIVIGSDQVGLWQENIIGKPHTLEKAKASLKKFSGQTFTFYTGLSVIFFKRNYIHTSLTPFSVTFRTLSEAEIDAYVEREKPIHCAGSFKCDELGITLFDKLEGEDINSLIGLPLIKLNKILIELNHNPLLWPTSK